MCDIYVVQSTQQQQEQARGFAKRRGEFISQPAASPNIGEEQLESRSGRSAARSRELPTGPIIIWELINKEEMLVLCNLLIIRR